MKIKRLRNIQNMVFGRLTAIEKVGKNNFGTSLWKCKGEKKTISEWSEILNLGKGALEKRLKNNWNLDRALSSKKFINQFI